MSKLHTIVVSSSSDEESHPIKKIKSMLNANDTISITPVNKKRNDGIGNKYENESIHISDDDSDIEEIMELNENNHESNKSLLIKNGNTKPECNVDNGNSCEIIEIDQFDNNHSKENILSCENTDLEAYSLDAGIKHNNEETEEIKHGEKLVDITFNKDLEEIKYDELLKENSNQNFGSPSNISDNITIDKDTNLSENIDLHNQVTSSESKINEASSSKDDSDTKKSNTFLIESFIEKCTFILNGSEYDISKKVEVLRKYYKKCEHQLIECADFKKLIEANLKRVDSSISQALICFGEVFMHVKDLFQVNTVEVTKKEKIKLTKLEHAIKLLVKQIKDLEEVEVDFADEEDSSYMQLERYINRLNKVYQKYCEYLKTNPFAGRITHSKLNFVDSQYTEINRAISKKYKNNKNFPSYYEMENFVNNVVKENEMGLTESQVKDESSHCFKKLGELLQTRRKRELYDTHYMYIQDCDEDPANKDGSLNSILQSHFTKAQSEIETLCKDYVTKQDQRSDKESDNTNETETSENENE